MTLGVWATGFGGLAVDDAAFIKLESDFAIRCQQPPRLPWRRSSSTEVGEVVHILRRSALVVIKAQDHDRAQSPTW